MQPATRRAMGNVQRARRALHCQTRSDAGCLLARCCSASNTHGSRRPTQRAAAGTCYCHNSLACLYITHSLACTSLSPSSLTRLLVHHSVCHSSLACAPRQTQQRIVVQVKRRAFDSLNYHHHRRRRRHQKALHHRLLVKIHNSKS
jgi:hypothetical protein